jgi:hypothetical protein
MIIVYFNLVREIGAVKFVGGAVGERPMILRLCQKCRPLSSIAV